MEVEVDHRGEGPSMATVPEARGASRLGRLGRFLAILAEFGEVRLPALQIKLLRVFALEQGVFALATGRVQPCGSKEGVLALEQGVFA